MVTIKQRLKLNQNTMRKTVILLMTLTLVVTSIGAAAAKPDKPDKPGKPDKSDEPVYYDVTMELVKDDQGKFLYGLSTTKEEGCSGADNWLVMRLEESRSGSLLATADGAFPSDLKTSEPDLYLKAGFTEPADRCWYGTDPDSTESNADFFRMVFDSDGALEKITWHFDVEMDEMEGTTVMHKYALTSQTKKGRNAAQVEWKGNLAGPLTGEVAGIFELWNYTNIDGPLWELIGTSELKFDLAIELTIEP